MDRRDFLRRAGLASAAIALPQTRERLFAAAPAPRWRSFEITAHVEIPEARGTTRVWVPIPPARATAYQKLLQATAFTAPDGRARHVTDARTGTSMIAAEWTAGTRPRLTVTSHVSTRDYAVDLRAAPGRHRDPTTARYLQPTSMIPTGGIVGDTAREICKDAATDLDKARAIYTWIVDNTHRDADVKGCGVGDIRFMLESGNLGGKCADLNALYVGLARAVGLPARDVYGIRVAKSSLGYASLGTSSGVISKSQHCRAEVFVGGYGWTPVDPADVRKVMLEEPPGNLPAFDGKVVAARERLFG